jgi:hypothetical protein
MEHESGGCLNFKWIQARAASGLALKGTCIRGGCRS